MADESAADDGALHTLFRDQPPVRVLFTLRTLRYLAAVRGTPTPFQKVLAADLANNPAWPLATHPIVVRILEA
jgi:hypothetical protein